MNSFDYDYYSAFIFYYSLALWKLMNTCRLVFESGLCITLQLTIFRVSCPYLIQLLTSVQDCDVIMSALASPLLLNCLFWRRSKKTSKLRVTGLGEGNSLVNGEFPTQRASNAKNISIWWCHHEITNSIDYMVSVLIKYGIKLAAWTRLTKDSRPLDSILKQLAD